MSYKVLLSNQARKFLLKVPKRDAIKLIDSINDLAENPYPDGRDKLEGKKQSWRIRVGDYRIIYVVNQGELIINVVEINSRGQIYKNRK